MFSKFSVMDGYIYLLYIMQSRKHYYWKLHVLGIVYDKTYFVMCFFSWLSL